MAKQSKEKLAMKSQRTQWKSKHFEQNRDRVEVLTGFETMLLFQQVLFGSGKSRTIELTMGTRVHSNDDFKNGL